MKYLLALLLAVVMLLTACAPDNKTPPSSEPSTTLTATPTPTPSPTPTFTPTPSPSVEPTPESEDVSEEAVTVMQNSGEYGLDQLTEAQLIMFEQTAQMYLDELKSDNSNIGDIHKLQEETIDIEILMGNMPINAIQLFNDWKAANNWFNSYPIKTTSNGTTTTTPAAPTTQTKPTGGGTKPTPSTSQQQQQQEATGQGVNGATGTGPSYDENGKLGNGGNDGVGAGENYDAAAFEKEYSKMLEQNGGIDPDY